MDHVITVGDLLLFFVATVAGGVGFAIFAVVAVNMGWVK